MTFAWLFIDFCFLQSMSDEGILQSGDPSMMEFVADHYVIPLPLSHHHTPLPHSCTHFLASVTCLKHVCDQIITVL